MQKMYKATGFSFTKIVIIESLDPSDLKTGQMLKTSIDAGVSEANAGIFVEFVSCLTRSDVIGTLERLIHEAELEGQVPVVHFECHGHSQQGLFCTDDSVVSWDTLNRYLTRLNRATGLNLLVVLAACHGGHFLKSLSPLEPSSCWAMVGPTESIDAADAMGGFRSFYRVAMKCRDIGLAAKALRGHSIKSGRWLSQHCEVWFESAVKNYVISLCNKKSIRQRTKEMYRQSIQMGDRKSIGSLKRTLKNLNRQNLAGKFFDAYFMINEIPNNTTRFANARTRIVLLLDALRATRQYAI